MQRTQPSARARSFLAWGVVTLLLATASAQGFDARSRTVAVAPSGADDTMALRQAFATCAAVGPGCTVRLAEGTFYTRQHVIRGFQGAFVDADMTLADLAFRVTQRDVTTPWNIFGMEIRVLATLVSLTGDRVRVDVERVAMESGEGSFFGANVSDGLYVQGVLPGPSGGFDDRPPFSGTVTVRDSRFSGPDGGVSIENLDGAVVSIRGSTFDGVLSVYVQDVAHSLIELVGNDIATVDTGVFLSAGGFRTPSGPSRVVVTGNAVRVPEGGHGVLLTDAGEALARIEAAIARARVG